MRGIGLFGFEPRCLPCYRPRRSTGHALGFLVAVGGTLAGMTPAAFFVLWLRSRGTLSSLGEKNLAARHLAVTLLNMQDFSQNTAIDPYNGRMAQGRPSTRKRTAFGQKLFICREASGLTQAQVAEQLGISQRAYAAWERDSVAILPDRLKLLASALGTTVAQLVGESSNERSSSGGRINRDFEDVRKLPRRQQAKILDVVEAMLAQQEAKAG